MSDKLIPDLEIIAKVKRDFQNYKFYNKQIIEWLFTIEGIEARIYKVGGSFPQIPDGSVIQNIHKNSPLYEEIEELERKIKINEDKVSPINEFRKTLNKEEEFMLNKIYFDNDNWTYDKLGMFLYRSVRALKRDVDSLCLKYWHSVHDYK